LRRTEKQPVTTAIPAEQVRKDGKVLADAAAEHEQAPAHVAEPREPLPTIEDGITGSG
jgi:hypothetical protein